VAVDTLSTSNADVERGSSAANNTVINGRNMTTTKCHQHELYQHTVEPLNEKWDPEQHVGLEKKEEQLTQQMAQLIKT